MSYLHFAFDDELKQSLHQEQIFLNEKLVEESRTLQADMNKLDEKIQKLDTELSNLLYKRSVKLARIKLIDSMLVGLHKQEY